MAKLQSGTRVYGNTTIDTFITVGANASITGTTNATSNSTGTLTVAGGVGIKGNVFTGSIYITGASNNLTFVDGTTLSTSPTASISAAFTQANSANTLAANSYIQANLANAMAYAAFAKANTGGSGYLANSVIFANTNGYLSNVSSLQFFSSNNTLVTTNLTLSSGSGGLITFQDGTTQATAASGAATDTIARTQANASFIQANTANTLAANSYIQANAAFIQANSANTLAANSYIQANASFIQANSANTLAANSYIQANASFIQANSANTLAANSYIQANASFIQANSANTLAANSYIQANASFIQANSANTLAANSYIQANASFIQANSANTLAANSYIQANAAFIQANSANTLAANSYIQANAAFIQANSANTLAANSYIQANAAFIQANSANTLAANSYIQANASFIQANSANTLAVNSYIQANAAFIQANSANTLAANSYIQANASFIQANSANTLAANSYIQANAAFIQANSANTLAANSYIQANAAFIMANAAFAKANTGGGGSGSLSINRDTFTASGSSAVFNLSSSVSSSNNIIVNLNGVSQLNSSYTISGTTLTLSETPVNGTSIDVITFLSGTTGGISASGYLANSIMYANTNGYLSNVANLQFFEANNTIVTTNIKLSFGSGGVITFADGTTQSTAGGSTTLPLILNDISNQFTGSQSVFTLFTDQTNITSSDVVDSRNMEVIVNGLRLAPYIKQNTYPWLTPYDSFIGFRVVSDANTANLIIYNSPAPTDQAIVTIINKATNVQTRKYPYSATTIALGD